MTSLSKPITADLRPREQRALYVLLSFFIPVIVLTLALIGLRIVPFGDKHSLAISDAKWYLNGQMFFARLLRGEENWLYSLNNGLGNNEWSVLAWGGVSFGGFLSLLAKLETIPSVFTWICVVNMSLCGLTMYLLLAYLYGDKFSHLIFSTSYALIGFNVVNCYQTLFFMGPQMLPLVALGLVKLLRGESPLVYILSLGTCILLDFYFGFHLCVFSVILFCVYLCLHWEELAGKVRGLFARWAVSSVLAGLLGAVVWLPTLKAYSGGGRLNQTGLEEYTFTENMPFIQIFSKLFSGANSTNELVIGLPNIFCGILVVALVILFFMDKKIGARYKKAAAVVLAIYLLSFYIPAFTLLMHGGTHTNWFPYRYSYVFSFLLILLAVEEFERLDEITLADTKRCGTALLIGVILFSAPAMSLSPAARCCWIWPAAAHVAGLLSLQDQAGGHTEKHPGPVPSAGCLRQSLCQLLPKYQKCTGVGAESGGIQQKYHGLRRSLTGALNDAEPGFFRMEKDESESNSVGTDPLSV